MLTLSISCIVALFVSLTLTPVARWVAHAIGAIDRPDGKRKLQKAPVALGGGVAVYIAFGVALLAASLFGQAGLPVPARLTLALAVSTGVFAVVGLIDDAWDLRPRTKLILQFLAASPVVIAGFVPSEFTMFGYAWQAGWLAVPLTLLWLVACANAMNLLDGLDGFSSTAGITLSTGIAAIACAHGNYAVAVAAVALAGALSGFLVFNLPPASIYLGDTGSMLIGLALGTMALFLFDISGKSVPVLIPATLMAIPMWDVVVAIGRRRMKRIPVGDADREHMHHQFITRGFSNWQALIALAMLCATTAVVASGVVFWGAEIAACVAVLGLLAALAHYRLFGHQELQLAARVIGDAASRVSLRMLYPNHLRPSAGWDSGNGTWSDVVRSRIENTAESTGMRSISIELCDEPGVQHAIWSASDDVNSTRPPWRITYRADSVATAPFKLHATLSADAGARPVALAAASTFLREFARHVAPTVAEQLAHALHDARTLSDPSIEIDRLDAHRFNRGRAA